MHARLSLEVIRLRFHGYLKVLPDAMARRFCEVDWQDRVAYVAVTGDPEMIVGVGRFDRQEEGVAEVAFVVEEAYQGRGLGTRLLRTLVAAAQERGIHTFLARVLYGNSVMRSLLEHTGYPLRAQRGRGEDLLWLTLPDKT